MKTLVIHPDDRSTDFLRAIYSALPDTKVLTHDVSRRDLIEQILEHDQIIACGHGTPGGLLNVANIGTGAYSISNEDAFYLRNKRFIAIWCNADQYIKYNQLNALYSGMFISEPREARMYNIYVDDNLINESNKAFSIILGHHLKTNTTLSQTYPMLKEAYAEVAKNNPVAKFNWDRLYLTEDKSMLGLQDSVTYI